MKFWKLVILVMFTLAVTGCVSLATPDNKDQHFTSMDVKKRQRQLIQQNRFTASGAFSIQEVGKKPVLANYQWIQNTQRDYSIRIYSPLNLFNLNILGRRGSVILYQSSKKQIAAKTPEQLVWREMGWNLPIRNLFYWIRGAIAPGSREVAFDRYGHVDTLQQDGWSIKYSYYSKVNGYDLPEKLVLSRPNVRMTLVIKNWIY